jgi:Carboxypeptidase regulatory-like domain
MCIFTVDKLRPAYVYFASRSQECFLGGSAMVSSQFKYGHSRVIEAGLSVWRKLWLVPAFLLASLVPGFAQINANATVSGHVTDPSGAAIPNASVVISDETTGVSSTVVTNSAGYYVATFLKPGTYTVKVSATGFEGGVRQNLTLQIQQVAEQDFQLSLGQVQQQVTVTGGAPLLNTESTELGNVVTEESAQQLPLNGRNFSQLGVLVPGANSGAPGSIRSNGDGNETQRAGAEIVANGSRGSFNLFMIDGLDDRDQSVGTVKVFPNLEDIGQFKVQIGNYDAEFGAGGAVVNVITRSGSNQIHGSAFDFFRNASIEAVPFFDKTAPPFQLNQFGGSIGGPIRRNRTFFFADYQGLRVKQTNTSLISEPTPALRSGNFSSLPGVIYDPNTYNAATNTRQPFPGNTIPQDRINPVAQSLLAIFPLPTLSGLSNNLLLNVVDSQVQDQFDVRIDQTLGSKDSMFGRYTWGRANIDYPGIPLMINGTINPYAFAQGTATAGSLTLNKAPSQQATIQEVHTFSPTFASQLALGYTRFALSAIPLDDGHNLSDFLGVPGSDVGGGTGLVSLSISSFQGYGETNLPEIVPQNTYQLSETLSSVLGAHSLTYGASVVHNQFGFDQLAAQSGSFGYTGVYTNNPAKSSGTGSAFADFLLGLPASSSKSSLPDGQPFVSYSEIGAFVQDSWRASPRLTFTGGLRWDLFTPPTERDNRQADFNPSGAGTLQVAGQNGTSSGILQMKKFNISPRLGFAYRVGGATVVRGAYGFYFFNEQGTGGSARLFINYPFAETFTVSCSATAPCLSSSTGIPDVSSGSNLPTAVYQPVSNPTPNMQQWNLTVERQINASLLARVSYVGSKGTHLPIALNPNVATPGPGTVASRQPYPTFGTIQGWEPIGPSSYNGLQLSAEKRLQGGLSFLAAYTFSKSLDEGAGGNSSTGESRLNVQNPNDLAANYGLSNFNIKNRFTLSGIYQLPVGRGRKYLANSSRLIDGVAGGWQVTSILTLQSGAPLTVDMATTTSNTGTLQRPNQVCNGNLPASQQTIKQFYNTSCFVAPPLYTFGDTGRNVIIGPGYEDWDVGVMKEFHPIERFALQFRAESFNALNHPNFSLPNGSIGSSSAGTITSTVGSQREFQLALRLAW